MKENERQQMGEAIGNDIERAKRLVHEAGMIPPLAEVHQDPLLALLRSIALERGLRKDDTAVMASVFDLLKEGLADGPVSFNPNQDEVIGEFKHSLQALAAPAEYCAEQTGMLCLIAFPPIGDDFSILVAPTDSPEGKLFYFDGQQHRWRSRVAHEGQGIGSKRKILDGEIEQLIATIPSLTLEAASETGL